MVYAQYRLPVIVDMAALATVCGGYMILSFTIGRLVIVTTLAISQGVAVLDVYYGFPCRVVVTVLTLVRGIDVAQ